MNLLRYSDEEGVETADSLEIKPPQAVVRRHKSSSRRKHSDRSNERREEKASKSRHDHSSSANRNPEESRYREKHSSSSSNSRHRRHGEVETAEPKIRRRSDSSKRDRESSRHEGKERSAANAERMLKDLRER